MPGRPASPRELLIPGFPRLLHGGDYNPDQWIASARHRAASEPSILDEDLRLMELSGCNTFAVGIFAWTSYEAAEGTYGFDWLDRVLDRLGDAGHRVVLATPSGAKPAWMSKKYPEIRRVDRTGLREPHQGRHNHCWQSPVYRDKVYRINARLAERYHAHPALGMWHISNEYSGQCYCELCLARFHEWLEEKYGTLAALNDAWWSAFWSHTFTEFSEINPRDESIDGLKLDFFRFGTDQILDFMRWEIAAIREHSTAPCTTNLMGTFPPVDYARLVEAVDLVSDDQYPAYDPDDPALDRVASNVSFKNDLLRCFKPDRPWMLMESCPDAPQWKHPVRLKRPGLHRAEMLQALGHGAEGTCYFQWRKGRGGSEKLHGAVVDHVGHEHTRTFRAVQSLSSDYDRIKGILGSAASAKVALLYDWEVRCAFEATDGVRSGGGAYQEICVDHHAALARLGVAVDVLASDRDFSEYAVVVAPQLWMLKPGVAENIARFVAAGGTFVATFYSGVCDEFNRCLTGGWPGEGLLDVFGIWNEETDWLPEGATRRVTTTAPGQQLGLAEGYEARGVCALTHLRGAEALAVYDEDFFAGSPALTVKHAGRGAAYYHTAPLGARFLRDFYAALMRDARISGALGGELPEGVHVQRRVGPEQEFLFLQNFSAVDQTLTLPHAGYVDCLAERPAARAFLLPGWASTVLSRQHTDSSAHTARDEAPVP